MFDVLETLARSTICADEHTTTSYLFDAIAKSLVELAVNERTRRSYLHMREVCRMRPEAVAPGPSDWDYHRVTIASSSERDRRNPYGAQHRNASDRRLAGEVFPVDVSAAEVVLERRQEAVRVSEATMRSQVLRPSWHAQVQELWQCEASGRRQIAKLRLDFVDLVAIKCDKDGSNGKSRRNCGGDQQLEESL